MIRASTGDDQYVFDRGSGRDTVTDMRGLDHIQFGPGVRESELLFEVVGDDLYIGIAPEGNADGTLRARDMSDRIRIVGRGVREVGGYGGPDHRQLVEYVTVDNVNIDLRTLDLRWTIEEVHPPAGPGEPGGPEFRPGRHIPPLVFDLDGDGLELVGIDESQVMVRGEGRSLTRAEWVGSDDGSLALDRNDDGRISAFDEISFVQDVEGAATDLEGLAAYDSNGDGVLDGSDARFAEFSVWQDLDQDGESKAGEVRSLAEWDITSIALTAHTPGTQFGGEDANTVFGYTAIGWADGEEGVAGDVGLRVRYAGLDADLPPEFLTGLAGFEHVRADALEAFVEVTTTSAWAKAIAERSPLLAQLAAAEAKLARQEALGLDTGYTQDELLAQFESSLSGDSLAGESSLDGASLAEASLNDNSSPLGNSLSSDSLAGRAGGAGASSTLPTPAAPASAEPSMTDPSRARGLFADAYAASVTRYGRQARKELDEIYGGTL